MHKQNFDKSKTNLQHIPYIVTYLANYFVQRKNFSFLADVISRKITDFNETLDLDFTFENKNRTMMQLSLREKKAFQKSQES